MSMLTKRTLPALALVLVATATGCGTAVAPVAPQGQTTMMARTAPPSIPAWKKVLMVRDLTSAEQSADLSSLVRTAHDLGRAQGAGPMLEYAVDNLTADLGNRKDVTVSVLFTPPKSFASVLEVIVRDGKIGVYDWGKLKSLQFIQMKAMQGEPVGGIASLDQIKNVRESLLKAGLRAGAQGFDSSSVYFNPLPKRKPDLTVEWFPAYVAVTYKGHYAQGKYVLNAESGEIISSPKP